MNKENNIFLKAQDLEKWGQIYEPQLELKLDEANKKNQPAITYNTNIFSNVLWLW